jgi:hypothetical protein
LILTVDGKPAKQNAKMPRLHVRITGTFGDLLLTTFSPDALPLHEYALGQKPERLEDWSFNLRRGEISRKQNGISMAAYALRKTPAKRGSIPLQRRCGNSSVANRVLVEVVLKVSEVASVT